MMWRLEAMVRIRGNHSPFACPASWLEHAEIRHVNKEFREQFLGMEMTAEAERMVVAQSIHKGNGPLFVSEKTMKAADKARIEAAEISLHSLMLFAGSYRSYCLHAYIRGRDGQKRVVTLGYNTDPKTDKSERWIRASLPGESLDFTFGDILLSYGNVPADEETE